MTSINLPLTGSSSLFSRALPGLLLCLAAALSPAPASAHKASDAYMRLDVSGNTVEQRTDIALRDLDRELVLDADEDGQLTWGEVRSQWARIDELAVAGFALQADGQPCRPGPMGTAQLDSHSDGRYAVLTRRWTCAAPITALSIGYSLFVGSDPTHRGILRLAHSGAVQGGERSGVQNMVQADVQTAAQTAVQTAVLVPGAAPQRFLVTGAGESGNETGAATPSSFFGFVAEGVHHILIGTDHVLFLLALLLPAVLVTGLRRRPGGGPAWLGADPVAARRRRYSMARTAALAQPHPTAGAAASLSAAATLPWRRPHAESDWRPAPALRPVLIDVAKVVTAFTLAHSITLALAVLGILNPPSRVVESIIAATVALAAIDNLYPFLPRERWKLTFVFGLVHGFGFAGALQDLGLAKGALASSLVGFNLGVEIGQLGIVALFLPLAWWSRESAFYRRVVLGGGSVVIALLALLWLAERSLDLTILG